jgi:NAD(P)H-hydrate epimerase
VSGSLDIDGLLRDCGVDRLSDISAPHQIGETVQSLVTRVSKLEPLTRELVYREAVALVNSGPVGGLVAARYLAEGGATVAAFICPPKNDGAGKYPELVSVNLAKAKAAGVAVTPAGPGSELDKALAWCHLAIDALLGTGATGKPAGAIHHMIREMTAAKKPVIAVDVPSGLHPDTGYHSGVFVVAELTLTLGLPKRGLLAPHAKPQVGVLKVLDIGYPPALLTGRALK